MLKEGLFNEKTKKLFKIGLILIFVFILIFLLIKFLILKPEGLSLPPEIAPGSPEAAAINYFLTEQEDGREESEKYLFSDLSKVRILGEEYQDLRLFSWTQLKKKGDQPKFQIQNSQIEETKANITLEETTNKNEEIIFFSFALPEKIIFEITLERENDQWKIIRIDSPTLVRNKKIGEKVEIGKNVFLKILNLEDSLMEKETKYTFLIKYISLEVEYQNDSRERVYISPFTEWKIEDEKGKLYLPPPPTSASVLREPVLLGGKLEPGEKTRGFIMFEVPIDRIPGKVIFQNLKERIIFF